MWQFSPGKSEVELEWEDETPCKGSSYYYLRVIQEDFAIAWSSPVWVEYDGENAASNDDILSLPAWNEGPEWPDNELVEETDRYLEEAMFGILKRRGIYEKFHDLKFVGVFEENRGRFSFFRGHDFSDGSRVHAAHYFDFSDERILIEAGWSPYGQVEY